MNAHNFTQCQRSDGSVYSIGEGKKCRKGKETFSSEMDNIRGFNPKEEAANFAKTLEKDGWKKETIRDAVAGYLTVATDPNKSAMAQYALMDAFEKGLDPRKLPKEVLKENGVSQRDVTRMDRLGMVIQNMKPVKKVAFEVVDHDRDIKGDPKAMADLKPGQKFTGGLMTRLESPDKFFGLSNKDVKDIAKGNTDSLDDVFQGQTVFMHTKGVREISPGVYVAPFLADQKILKNYDTSEDAGPRLIVASNEE